MILVSYFNYDPNLRIISGCVLDYSDNFIPYATIILYVKYSNSNCRESMDRIGFLATNEFGEFTFSLNISKYRNCDFVLEIFNPITEIL